MMGRWGEGGFEPYESHVKHELSYAMFVTGNVNYGSLVEFVLALYSTTRLLLTANTFQCGFNGWLAP